MLRRTHDWLSLGGLRSYNAKRRGGQLESLTYLEAGARPLEGSST
jgi:hypothetical protein